MASVDEIVLALRCTASAESVCRKEGCPYYSRMSPQKQREYCRNVKLNPDKVTDEFWDDCDYDRIAMDAAELIEEQAGILETRPMLLSCDDLVKMEQVMQKSSCIDRIYAEV